MVVVNSRQGGCHLCKDYIGKVFIDDVYSGGKKSDGNYPLLSDAIQHGLFHPNCKDSTSTYFEGITTLEPLSSDEREELDRRRKLEAQKNYYDNQAEKCDRISKYSLDEENKRVYKKRADICKNKADEIGGKIAESLAKSDGSGIIKVRKTTLPVNIQLFANIPKDKFTKYALDPIKQPDKAKAFKVALGYTLDNYQDLIDNIQRNFNEDLLKLKAEDKFGKRFELVMCLKGPNGKDANVCTAWIKETDNSELRLTSAYVTKKEVTK